ncbi:hypothetical protein [Ellagibacter sp.]|uniref:hypothetical protein n=1 Tax=Ellagibacter sp. TaxID=2137578 RepID=UPI003AB8B9A7
MDFNRLNVELEALPPSQRKAYRELIALVSLGGDVLPSMKGHLEQASTMREFFDLIYEDDSCRFEKAWALWAKMSNKDWYSRFKPEKVYEGALVERGGVVIDCNESMILIPVRGVRAHDRTVDIFLFPDDGFNVDLGEYYGSISGSFTCYGLPLEGTFDIYRAGRALLFERWVFDELGYRKRRASQKGACACSL